MTEPNINALRLKLDGLENLVSARADQPEHAEGVAAMQAEIEDIKAQLDAAEEEPS